MTTPSVHCEARLRGISKKHDKGGDYAQITLQVMPEDIPDALWKAPLGSIFILAFARVGDDGEAVNQEVAKPKVKAAFHTLPRCQQAGILCKDVAFQHWAATCGYPTDEAGARLFVHKTCHIDSRRELDTLEHVATIWDNLVGQFERETGRTAEARG